MKKRKRKKIPLSNTLSKIKFYFDLLSQASDNYLFITDLTAGTVMISRNLVEDFNLPGTTLRDFDSYWAPIIHDDDRAAYIKSIEDVMLNAVSDEHIHEYRVKNRQGEYVWIRCQGRILRDDNNAKPILFAGQMFKMGRRSQVDDVTGLFNKYRFEQAVRHALADYKTDGVGGALMIIGIDNFKVINETYNRYFGDQVLKMIAKQIKNILPQKIQLYRLDGDEFGIVYPYVTEEEVQRLFSSIQICTARVQAIGGKNFFCTVSAGTVFYPQAGKEVLTLYKYAEAALDMAKRNGKNCNCIIDKEQYNRWIRSLTMHDELKSSVEKNFEGFALFYQPVVEAKTKQIIGAEALLRWRNSRGKMVAPMEFIPVLESTQLIVPVGRWIMREALTTCKYWQQIIPKFKMSINVSYEQLKDSSFVPFVVELVKELKIDTTNLVLELTESTIVSDWAFLNQQFDRLRKNGIGIAMDDFGTGYSSLAYLKNLCCDIVKIDREFVKRISENEFDCRLVEYTVSLCHYVGIKTCIEGVEIEDEYELLNNICQTDFVQGYLFGRPEMKENFEGKYLSFA